MSEQVLTYPENQEPAQFTRAELGWLPWLPPVAEQDLTERHYAGLVERSRATSAYFRLLAHDPEVLGARTRADKDIFFNLHGGLPRGERELAAAAVSRRNGCIFCASVHARFAAHYAKRPDEVDRLLERGVEAPLQGDWAHIAHTASALSETPPGLAETHLEDLVRAGYDEAKVLDLIYASAFFNWANRLMLSLGEPTQGA